MCNNYCACQGNQCIVVVTDICLMCADRQTSIMHQLQDIIISHSPALQQMIDCLAELDWSVVPFSVMSHTGCPNSVGVLLFLEQLGCSATFCYHAHVILH